MQAGTSAKPLHRMFTAVPPRYDFINRVITLGRDRSWRHAAALECAAGKPARILDICCGTGDLAIDLARHAPEAEITALDYSEPMLEIARAKAAGLRKLSIVEGDVSSLPFLDGQFDCVGISFAFRNLTYRNPLTARYLAEIVRVLKPGGRFVIVESSQPASGFVRWWFRLYLRAFVYPVGLLLSGNRGAYRYLAESASRFYLPGEVAALLKSAGFGGVRYRAMLLGASGIHVATKP